MNAFQDAAARLLGREGALVERIEPDGLEVLFPPGLRETLGVAEFARLGFGPVLPDGATRIGLESDWMDKFEALAQDRGHLLRLEAETAEAGPPSAADLLPKKVVLVNATFRPVKVETAHTRYVVLVFRVTAISDEKREDLLTLCANEANGACAAHLAAPVLDTLRAGASDRFVIVPGAGQAGFWSANQIRGWCERAMVPLIRARLAPFLTGMERRMAKDLERLREYHTDLLREAAAKLADGARRRQEDDSTARRYELRIEAITREYEAKVEDVRRKYTMTVEARLAQSLHVVLPVHRYHFVIRRRKGERLFCLDWNGLSRKADDLACEGCGREAGAAAVCDEQLHLVCGACMAACPSCGKDYCRACHAAACPRCRASSAPPAAAGRG